MIERLTLRDLGGNDTYGRRDEKRKYVGVIDIVDDENLYRTGFGERQNLMLCLQRRVGVILSA